MKTIVLSTAFLIAFVLHADARVLYVSPTGSDTSGGTIDNPFKTLTKGYSIAVAGDTIMLRGGTYISTAANNISKSGNSTNRYYIFAYPGEHPLLDYTTAPAGARGINLSGSYWHIKGLDIYHAPDNGMNITGSNNIVEQCILRENGDTGLQLGNGASNNQIINCDSYFNVDASQGNADGFAPKLNVGTGNYFYGCRAWQNSDDGWDGYIRPRPAVTPVTTMENCWCFRNGYLKSGAQSSGNGNGFKMGGSDSANLSHTMILKKCLSFQNRVKGYDQNNNRGNMTLLNCSAFSNGTNYGMNTAIDAGSVMTLKNCLATGTGAVNILASAVQATNSWLPPFTVNDSDFVSLDTTGVRGPRNPDGSLPVLPFMRLAAGSDLIDAGTDVGLPFNGAAPDLGCFETDGPTSVGSGETALREFRLEQNYPNPFNPVTNIRFSVEKSQQTTLAIFNVIGQQVAVLFDAVAEAGRFYSRTLHGNNLASGVYFYRLQSGERTDTKRLLLLK